MVMGQGTGDLLGRVLAGFELIFSRSPDVNIEFPWNAERNQMVSSNCRYKYLSPRPTNIFARVRVPLELWAVTKLGRTCSVEEFGITFYGAWTTARLDLTQFDSATDPYGTSGRKKCQVIHLPLPRVFHKHTFGGVRLFTPDGPVQLHIVDLATRSSAKQSEVSDLPHGIAL